MQRQTLKTVEKTACKKVLPSKNIIKICFAFIKVVVAILENVGGKKVVGSVCFTNTKSLGSTPFKLFYPFY